MRGKTILYSIVEIAWHVAGNHRLVSAYMIFNVADVKLGVLFTSHHMFSPIPTSCTVTAGFTYTQKVSCPFVFECT